MFVKERATRIELIRTGRVPTPHSKRSSHGFGKERGLIEGPEKGIEDKKIISNLRKLTKKPEIEGAMNFINGLKKRDRTRLKDKIRAEVEIMVGQSSLSHSDTLEVFAKLLDQAKNKRNTELQSAIEIYNIEKRIVKSRNVSGKIYYGQRKYSKDQGEKAQAAEITAKEWFARIINDEEITPRKIRFPAITNPDEKEFRIVGKNKVVKIAKTGIRDDAHEEVFEITIEEKN